MGRKPEPALVTRPYLSRRERQVYDVLRAAGGDVVSHARLIAAVYGPDALPGDREGIKVHVLRLRRKGYVIRNLRGEGYALGTDGRCPTCGGKLSG